MILSLALPGGTSGKSPPVSAGDSRCSSGREAALQEGTAAHSSVPSCRIPWTGNLAGYSRWSGKESDVT